MNGYVALDTWGPDFLAILLNDGSGHFAEPTMLPILGGSEVATLTDLDADGDIDIVVGHRYSSGRLVAFDNNGVGEFTEGQTLVLPNLRACIKRALHA